MWELNPYYNPDGLGLVIVAEVDFGGSYEFDKVVVWRTADGKLVWASDSGCSCPTPFEGYTSLGSLEPLSNWKYFEETVRSMARYSDTCSADRFLREVENLL